MKRFWIIYFAVVILACVAFWVNYKSCYMGACDSNGRLVLPLENSSVFPIADYKTQEVKFYGRQKGLIYSYYDSEGKYLFSSKIRMTAVYNNVLLGWDFFGKNCYALDRKGNELISATDFFLFNNRFLRIKKYIPNEVDKTINLYDTDKRKLLLPKDSGAELIFFNYDYQLQTGFIPILKNNLYGLMDFEGNFVLPCKYKHKITDIFENVYIFGDADNFSFGICDKNDKEITKDTFNYYDKINGRLYLTKINTSDHKTFIYDNVSLKESDFTLFKDYPYFGKKYDYYTIIKDRKQGVIDKKGQVIIEPLYDDIHIFSDNLGFSVRKIVGYEEDSMPPMAGAMPPGLGGSGNKPKKMPIFKYGYADTTGKVILPCKYDGVNIKKDFIEVYEDPFDNAKYYLFDKTGKKVINRASPVPFTFTKDKILANGIYDLKGNLLKDNLVYDGNVPKTKLVSMIKGVFNRHRVINNSKYSYVDLDTLKEYKEQEDYLKEKNPELKNESFELLQRENCFILTKHLGGRK